MKKMIKSKLFLEFLLMFSIYIFYYAFIKIKFSQGWDFFYFFNDMLIILFSLLIIRLIPSWKIRFIIIGIWNTMIYTLFLTNTFLIVFKHDIFSFSMLSQAAMGFGMLGSYNVFTAFNIFEWIINIGVFIMSFYYLFKVEKNMKEVRIQRQISGLAIACNFLFICICFLLAPSNDKELFLNPYYNKVKAFEKFGLLTYQMTDVNDYLTKNSPLSEEKIDLIDEYFEELEPVNTDDHSFGLLKDKNVIFVMLEGIESFMINEKYTPTLYKMMHESNYFPNMYSSYSNIGTYDAEFKSLASSMYYRGDNYYNAYANNAYPFALPNVLRNHGYSANSFHNYVGTFYNRNTMHYSIGFENFYSVEEMNYDFPNNIIPQWPNDETMFENMKELYAPIQDNPFFSFILTVSSHGGYDNYRDNLKEHYDKLYLDDEYKDKELNYLTYMATCMDTDKGLSIMLDYLEQQNLIDDTLVVVSSDHKNYSDMQMTYEYKELDETNPFSIEKVPLFIYNPSLGTKVIEKTVSHYDITPTVLYLLGIDYYQDFYYGQNVYINEPIRPIILGYNNWFDDNIIVYNDEIVSSSLDEAASLEYYLTKKQYVYETIEIHQSIFICDYFKLITEVQQSDITLEAS